MTLQFEIFHTVYKNVLFVKLQKSTHPNGTFESVGGNVLQLRKTLIIIGHEKFKRFRLLPKPGFLISLFQLIAHKGWRKVSIGPKLKQMKFLGSTFCVRVSYLILTLCRPEESLHFALWSNGKILHSNNVCFYQYIF